MGFNYIINATECCFTITELNYALGIPQNNSLVELAKATQ